MIKKIINPELEVVYNKNLSSDKTCIIYKETNESNKINFQEYINSFFDLGFYRNYFKIIKNKDNVKGVITGLSYFEVGIEENRLELPFINLALSSQDLFYDFEILKHTIENLNSSNNIKQAIIGLSNYSFRYDLSMTQNNQTKEKPKIYYPLLKNLHNYSNKKMVIDRYNMF